MLSQKFPTALLSFVAASAFFLSPSAFAGSECYYINGKPAGGVYRCDNSTSGQSSCCNAGQTCMSNGVCVATNSKGQVTDWLRVGCTDPTWNDPACLKQCTNLVPGSSCGIRPCGGLELSNQYCCDTTSNGPGSLACCSNSTNLFPVGTITTVTANGATTAYPYVVATIPLNAVKASSVTLTSASSSSSPSARSSSSSSSNSSSGPSSSSSVASSVASSSLSSSSASYYFAPTNTTSTSTAQLTTTATTTVPPASAAPSTTVATSVTTVSRNAAARSEIAVHDSLGAILLGGLLLVF